MQVVRQSWLTSSRTACGVIRASPMRRSSRKDSALTVRAGMFQSRRTAGQLFQRRSIRASSRSVMRVRALLAAALACLSVMARAQAITTSPAPDKVAVTVYRAANASGTMDLEWLQGFAIVRETRRVSLPAGESELRFEGVAGGIIPQSAIIEGLGDVVEKNRDAKLLSPGTLLDSLLGRRVHLRRISKATGAVREQEAVVRASGDGVVLETAEGIEALRC